MIITETLAAFLKERKKKNQPPLTPPLFTIVLKRDYSPGARSSSACPTACPHLCSLSCTSQPLLAGSTISYRPLSENVQVFGCKKQTKKRKIIGIIKNTNLPNSLAGSVRLLEGSNPAARSLLQPSGRQNSSESPNLVTGKFISSPPLFAVHRDPLFTTK